jgi:hypothetical protein
MSIVLSPAVGINTLHCGSCWLFQNVWELTQTHCIVDDTVGIDCFHCEQHCSALGAFLSCVFFFIKNYSWGACLLCQKLLGLTWQHDPTLLGSQAQNTSKRCQKKGWVWLGLAEQLDPISFFIYFTKIGWW